MPSATFTSKRFVRIDWKWSSIETAAKVLFEINRNDHKSEQHLRNYIIDLATNHAITCIAENKEPTIMGTGGWYVSFFRESSEDYSHGVEVTLMPYAVEKYLEKQGLI